jgi:bifunctional non-homologous end joining protein LigD
MRLPRKAASPARRPPDPSAVPGSRRSDAVPWPRPQLATLVGRPPSGEGWIHEIKFDGYRILALREGDAVKLFSRGGEDWAGRLEPLAASLRRLPGRRALLDGEMVALTPRGIASFEALQSALSQGRVESVIYYVFDLLYLEGYDLRESPLDERKRALRALVESAGEAARIRYADHVAGRGDDVFREACRLGLEGIVSKRRTAPYRPGRSGDWVKAKCRRRQEFVVIGFSDPGGTRRGLGALILGVHDAAGTLVYAGKVGSGFDEAGLARLRSRLAPLERPEAPVTDPPRGPAGRGIHWVWPRLVAEVEFTGLTRAGRVRQAVFRGLREDKPASEVVPEVPRPHVRLTHPDRILYPGQGITKRALADFYTDISAFILPHVERRPLSLVRCPEGQGSPCFYQKHVGEGAPPELGRVDLREEEGGSSTYLYVRDVAGLVALVQMGVLEIHPWGSRIESLERPDRCTFDLDPGPGVPWERVVKAAREMRARLLELGLESFVKTTGGKGLHVVLPLRPEEGWERVKGFARAIAREFAAREPAVYTAALPLSARRGRVFIDYLRNGRGATAVAAYSTRARPGAPVSVPLAWDELDPSVKSDRFTVTNLRKRLARLRGDPWKGFFEQPQSLPLGPAGGNRNTSSPPSR